MNRMQFMIEAYNNGKVAQDVFGQFACHGFDDKVAEIAKEQKWVSDEFISEYMAIEK